LKVKKFYAEYYYTRQNMEDSSLIPASLKHLDPIDLLTKDFQDKNNGQLAKFLSEKFTEKFNERGLGMLFDKNLNYRLNWKSYFMTAILTSLFAENGRFERVS